MTVWPAASQGLAVSLSGWLSACATEPDRSVFDWPGPSALAAFLPFVLGLLATGDAVTRGVYPVRERVHGALLHLRTLTIVFVPLAAYVLLVTPMRRSADLRAVFEEVRSVERLWLVAVVLVLGASLPFAVRIGLGLQRIGAGPLRTLHDLVARRLGVRSLGLFLWRTRGHEINAAVVGFAPWHRFVVVTDGMATGLEAHGALALLGHEMGHAARRHAGTFAAFSVALLGAAQAGADLAERGREWLFALPVLAIAAWLVGFGWISRRAELEADLVAAEVAGGPEPLARLLGRTCGVDSFHRDGWRHFSPAFRVLFARSAERHLEVSLRLARTLRRVRVLSLVGAAIAVAALVLTAWFASDGDWARAHLRRGEYGLAHERALAAGDGELASVAAVGEELAAASGEVPSRDALLALAERSLATGDGDRAEALVELAWWRGEGRLGPEGEGIAERLEEHGSAGDEPQ
ncbi:MAG: M48 family metalloprotease [Planctomycetota bacterium]